MIRVHFHSPSQRSGWVWSMVSSPASSLTANWTREPFNSWRSPWIPWRRPKVLLRFPTWLGFVSFFLAVVCSVVFRSWRTYHLGNPKGMRVFCYVFVFFLPFEADLQGYLGRVFCWRPPSGLICHGTPMPNCPSPSMPPARPGSTHPAA